MYLKYSDLKTGMIITTDHFPYLPIRVERLHTFSGSENTVVLFALNTVDNRCLRTESEFNSDKNVQICKTCVHEGAEDVCSGCGYKPIGGDTPDEN